MKDFIVRKLTVLAGAVLSQPRIQKLFGDIFKQHFREYMVDALADPEISNQLWRSANVRPKLPEYH